MEWEIESRIIELENQVEKLKELMKTLADSNADMIELIKELSE
jgi:uncharacterized coiled-coil protein SlyX